MKTCLLISTTLVFSLVTSGCGGKLKQPTGFLSDYSKLKKESANTMRYSDEAALATYTGFIVDPIQMRIQDPKRSPKPETIADLTGYMHDKLEEAVRKSGKRLAYHPEEGVARLRIALTDIGKSHPVSMLPYSSMAGVGVGGASVEAELVDSMTGKQIAAFIQSKEGESKIPFTALGDWTAAKQTIDAWAKNLQQRLADL